MPLRRLGFGEGSANLIFLSGLRNRSSKNNVKYPLNHSVRSRKQINWPVGFFSISIGRPINLDMTKMAFSSPGLRAATMVDFKLLNCLSSNCHHRGAKLALRFTIEMIS